MSVFADFADKRLWVGWTADKIPINPTTGHSAKSNDSDTWSDRATAENCARALGLAGVGINLVDLGNGQALLGIDLDTCRDEEGNVADWARTVIHRVGSYTEVSPSGTGFKIFFVMRIADREAIRADLRTLRRDPDADGLKWTGGAGKHPPAIELFTGRRYFTVTERHLQGTPAELRIVEAEVLRWVMREAGPALAERFAGANGHHQASDDMHKTASDNSRSGVAFRKALAMLRAKQIESYADLCAALRADPETADWVRDKGERHGERELRRIWEKVEARVAAAPHQIDPKAPLAVARRFRDLHFEVDGDPTLHQHRGAFYAWNGSAYPEMDEAEVRAGLYAFLDACVATTKDSKSDEWRRVPVRPNAALVNNVLDALRAESLLPASIEAPAWLDERAEPRPADVVACANGLLHLPSGDLLPSEPTFFTHNALDFAYDPAAAAPAGWLAFLSQLWPDDAESIETLQEIFGYCLGAETSQQKAFLLVGPKRSGKGTIARVLAKLVGKENAVAPTLASLGTNFGLAPLIGKRVAIVSDARLGGRADQAVIAERLLSITGEDGITVDRKYRDAWTGRLDVRFLVLTNELPRLNDASGALASRFIVLPLTKSFFGREDPGLTNRLLAELPGILNWAIAGWRRLRDRGYFVQPTAATEMVAELEDLGSPIMAFVRDYCEVGPGKTASVEALYGCWQAWCAEQGRDHPGNKQTFGRDLRAAVSGLRVARPRGDGERERVYEGIGLRTATLPREGEIPF